MKKRFYKYISFLCCVAILTQTSTVVYAKDIKALEDTIPSIIESMANEEDFRAYLDNSPKKFNRLVLYEKLLRTDVRDYFGWYYATTVKFKEIKGVNSYVFFRNDKSPHAFLDLKYSYTESQTETEYVFKWAKNLILDNDWILNSCEYTKARWAFNVVLDTVEYDYSLQNRTGYRALMDKIVVCAGYAQLYYVLATCLGLEVIYVHGEATGGGSHAWNLVKLDGKWYLVDATWSDNPYYDLFLVSPYSIHKAADVYNSLEFDYATDRYYYAESKVPPNLFMYGIKFAYDGYKINIGESLELSKPNEKLSYIVISSDPTIVSVNEHTITGIRSGEVILHFSDEVYGMKKNIKVYVSNE